MPDIDWKLVLAKHFDKPIQKTGRHAYRLIHPITIRVDETDISLPKGSLFVFEQEGVAVVRESVQSAEKYNIALKSISLVTVEQTHRTSEGRLWGFTSISRPTSEPTCRLRGAFGA
jgi:hypothetical protein